MEHSTRLSEHVNASPEKVWEVLTNVPEAPETLSGVTRVEMLSDGPYGVGTRWKETRTMAGRAETVEMWVAEAEPLRSTTIKAAQGGADYTTRFTLAPRDGGTELAVDFSAEVSRPSAATKVMTALFGRIGMAMTRKALAKDLAEIKAKAESIQR